MRRYDVSHLAVNIGNRICDSQDKIITYLEALHREVPPAKRDAVIKLAEMTTEVAQLADIVVGAASSRYPIAGLEPWMFEGCDHAVRLPLQQACRKEMLAGHMAVALMQFTDQLAGDEADVKKRLSIPEGATQVPMQTLEAVIGMAGVSAEIAVGIYRLVCGQELAPNLRDKLMMLGETCPALIDFLTADDKGRAEREAKTEEVKKEVALAREHARAQAQARAQATSARLAMQRLATEAKRKERVEVKYGSDEARAEVRLTKAQERKAERLARAEERKQRAIAKVAAKKAKQAPGNQDTVH